MIMVPLLHLLLHNIFLHQSGCQVVEKVADVCWTCLPACQGCDGLALSVLVHIVRQNKWSLHTHVLLVMGRSWRYNLRPPIQAFLRPISDFDLPPGILCRDNFVPSCKVWLSNLLHSTHYLFPPEADFFRSLMGDRFSLLAIIEHVLVNVSAKNLFVDYLLK